MSADPTDTAGSAGQDRVPESAAPGAFLYWRRSLTGVRLLRRLCKVDPDFAPEYRRWMREDHGVADFTGLPVARKPSSRRKGWRRG